MSAEPSKAVAEKGPTAVELYRIAAFTAAMLFAWCSWSAYDPPALAIAILVLVAAAGLVGKTTLAPMTFLAAFLMMEAFGPRVRSTPTLFVIIGSLLGLWMFSARGAAAAEPIRRRAPPRRGFWRTLSTPIRQLFRKNAGKPPTSIAGNMDEVVWLLVALLAAVVGGWWVLRNAPVDAFLRIRMGMPSSVATIAAVLLPFAVGLLLARTAFWFIDPKRRDAQLAEMELNELVWTELRPELTRAGAFLGSAAAKQPELSAPADGDQSKGEKPIS